MKRILSIFLCLTLILGFCPGQTAYAAAEWPSEISISADGGILMDINSGAVLFEKNSHEPYYPASITKILTALIVIENCGLDETVTFSNTAVNSLEPNSSILGARAGDTLSVRDCLYALLLQSANEVANALAEQNDLIHIGCPIPFDIEVFLGQLETLMETAYKNKDNIRDVLKEVVSTYHPAE